jgi:hypothetical protein
MNVAELAKEVDLLDVRTTGTLSRLDRGPAPTAGEQIDALFSLRAAVGRNGANDFDVFFSIDCRPRRNVGDRAFARFVYRAVARYRAQKTWPDDVLEGFMRTNAMLHLWPYARQYVQAASAQLGLLPIILPPFRVKPAGVAVGTPPTTVEP